MQKDFKRNCHGMDSQFIPDTVQSHMEKPQQAEAKAAARK